MPSYVKFLKDILPKKKSLGAFKVVTLIEECSAIIQNKLLLKLKDLGNFTISCTISTLFFVRALSDLGVGINLMPWSIYNKRIVIGCRVCMDYQKLNKATRKDHFSLLFIDKMLDRLAGKEFYYFLDGYSMYN
ncbi:Uncharacterized protein TCM_039395 [Theobroma cacao]|uniref:Uncharacterized protein n=1 Tax=Theobroma cacao TaxID=3641 RepID=A0A061GXZ6_THECC|nr:Uncharacterized protein TCM_039395 [Theobroma cacao]